MYEPFTASASDEGSCEFGVQVILSSYQSKPVMCIKASDEFIYITKEQAMKFFGLVEPMPCIGTFSNSTEGTYVCVWPNGIWCFPWALNTTEYFDNGEGYKIIVVSDDDPDAIDSCIAEHLGIIHPQ